MSKSQLLPVSGHVSSREILIDADTGEILSPDAGVTMPVVYTQAKQALAECCEIDECKDWADKAAALKSYAKQANDETLQKLAIRIQARAIRRCGELLKQIESQSKANLVQNRRDGTDPSVTRTQAAKSAGLSERQRKTALRVASVPDAAFEDMVESYSPLTVTEIAEQGKRKSRKDKSRKAPELKSSFEGVSIRAGDFREVLSDVFDIHAIITDPPYGKEFLPLWNDLGKFAAEHLAPNGVLIAYSGQMYLPQVYAALSEHLDYFWTLAVVHSGGGNLTPLGFPVRKVINQWKPILFYCRKGDGFPYTFRDLVQGVSPDKSKHNWAQPVEEAHWLINQFTHENALVVDPFSGSGTVGEACINSGRNFIGAEILLSGQTKEITERV